MGTRKAGKRKLISENIDYPSEQRYVYVTPGVSFECEKLTDFEIAKLSGPVRTYNLKDIKGD